MYIIEFEKGVYATSGIGDPARTLKIENATRYSTKSKAKKDLKRIIKEVQSFRKFSNPRILFVEK